jgi:hypothetical protein
MQQLQEHAQVAKPTSAASPLVWVLFVLLCLIGAGAAMRRIVVLMAPPPVQANSSPAGALDSDFASRKVLTLCHIIPALFFVSLAPFWFLPKVRSQPTVHRRISGALLILGSVIGVTAFILSLHPVGGINEATAAILYNCLFLFSLARAALMFSRHDVDLHRTWMMRAIAVLLGIATTRPVMGVFFATASITHLRLEQFFGTAFWIGFTVTYIAGEAYLRSHPVAGYSRGIAVQS